MLMIVSMQQVGLHLAEHRNATKIKNDVTTVVIRPEYIRFREFKVFRGLLKHFPVLP